MSQTVRLLLIEDNALDAELVIRELRKAGFDPQWQRVDTRDDFLGSLHGELDVVLSDFDLPQFSATEALDLLQQSGHDIPFIIVSGTIGEETAVAAMRQGASDYLIKDRLGRLGLAISQAMDSNRQRRSRDLVEAELMETQERFNLLAQTVAEVFWITSADQSELTYVSPGYEKTWGRPVEELQADPQSWLNAIHPEDRERVTAAAGPSEIGSYDVEYRIIGNDGQVRWIHDRALPVYDEQGAISNIVGVARDITARRQLEAEFRQAQKMEALGMLATGVAHDFNNLLTVIGGNATLLRLPGASSADIQEWTEEITAAVDSAAALTSQLLMFSRKKLLQRRVVNLNEVMANTMRLLSRMLEAEVAVQLETDPHLPFVDADPGMLEQVLMNLAVNARDAMPEGGQLILRTSTESRDSESPWVVLSVIDSGEGMPPDVSSRIFEPFFTTKESGHGTGLGLATVFGILEQHNGKIEVQSEVGGGSTFRVLIPSCPDPPEAPPAASVLPVTAGRGNHGILVVDDEKAVRIAVSRLLEKFGYQVFQAESGPAALALWPEHMDDIALVLTDMVMPDGLNGYDLIERLRQDRPELKAILTSGYSADLATKGKTLQQSFGFLQKPYEVSRLADMLKAHLGHA